MTQPISLPNILALETSSRTGSIALAKGPELLVQQTLPQSSRHAAALLPTLKALLNQQNWRTADIEQIYLSTGPGSFTGLRIGITIARSLRQALGCQLVGVGTLDVIAQNASTDVQNLVVILDAKRGQVFAARYAREDGEFRHSGKDARSSILRLTAGPVLTDPAEFVRQTPAPVAILGEGIEYHRAALQVALSNPADLVELPKSLWAPTAAAVHALGYERAQKGLFSDPSTLLPTYIRLAEAEELWQKGRRHCRARYNSDMSEVADTLCHRCGTLLHPGRGDFFLIKIEAFSDPSPPVITPTDMKASSSTSLAALVHDMEKFSAQELMDFVYRKLTLTLCTRCYKSWIENPTP